MSFSRYASFKNGGKYRVVPFIKVPEMPTDCYTYYHAGRTRLDVLSYQYYGDANYGWLILQANPQYGSLEFKIADNSRLRIPYPLDNAIQGYESEIRRYEKLYGLE